MHSFKLRVLSGLSGVLVLSMAAVSLHAMAAGGITGKWKGSMGMGNKYDQTLELTLQEANSREFEKQTVDLCLAARFGCISIQGGSAVVVMNRAIES
jgi:hypothetical protein